MAAQDNFSCRNWDDLISPVFFSVPHAGREYSDEILSNLRMPPEYLPRLEDRYADLLTRAVERAGYPVIMAHRPRAWMDLNRASDDLDRGMLYNIPDDASFTVSGKQLGGLGLIPRRLIKLGDIWKHPIDYVDVQSRVEEFHQPYHDMIAQKLLAVKAKFGCAILIDIHSMPTVKSDIGEPPDFVVGDKYGCSASSLYSGIIQSFLTNAGYNAELNFPYAGDYILKRHGKPAKNIHAIQLETDRRLYLDSHMREPTENVSVIAELIEKIAIALSDQAQNQFYMDAAE